MAFVATNEPSAYGAIGASGNDSWFDGKVYSYLVASAVSIAKGDFVKLASSTTNTINKCSSSAHATNFIGIAVTALDNSAETVASTRTVGVLREGIAFADILVASSSGTQKSAVFFDSLLYLADTETNQDVTGQALTSTANDQPIARSIDRVDVPSATALYKGRVYINTLLKATPVA